MIASMCPLAACLMSAHILTERAVVCLIVISE